MKPHFPLPLFAALVLQGFMISGLQAQITTDNSPTPEELVSFLVGPDVQVSNVSFSGALSQRGTCLNNNSNLTISEGIVLSSGDISLMIGPNDNTSAGLNVNGVGNADLDNLSGQTTFDAAILEFDFIATGDSLTFNYSFASEEYNEFVNANVNDVFGLFLDGPGIAGPFTNQSINLAIVPETGGTPVSINTVNNDVNPNYYFDNEATSVANETQMDGFTVTLEAGTVLQ